MNSLVQNCNVDVSGHQCLKLQSIGGSSANDCHTKLNSEITMEEQHIHVIKEEPNLLKHEMSPTTSESIFGKLYPNLLKEDHIFTRSCGMNGDTNTSKFIFGEALIPAIHLDINYKIRDEDPLAISPVKERNCTSDQAVKTDQLLTQAAERLRMRLKPNWICLTEGDGIQTIQLSRNFEKCTQRRIFFTRCGNVHLSVHCVPIPISKFVPCLDMVTLQNQQHISPFVDAMENIVNIVRQLEICTGVCHDKYKPLWESNKRGEVDKNPYQEARYSVTFRSIQCSRLVRPRKRMCYSCERLLDCLRLKARSMAKSNEKYHPLSTNVTSKSAGKKNGQSGRKDL